MKLRIILGNLIRKLGRKICGDYWICHACGNIKYREEEIICWDCGIGDMIYQGEI